MSRKLRNRTIHIQDKPSKDMDNEEDLTLTGAAGIDTTGMQNFSFGSGETRVAGFDNANAMILDDQTRSRGAYSKQIHNSRKDHSKSSQLPKEIEAVDATFEQRMHDFVTKAQEQTLKTVQEMLQNLTLNQAGNHSNGGRTNQRGFPRRNSRHSFPNSDRNSNVGHSSRNYNFPPNNIGQNGERTSSPGYQNYNLSNMSVNSGKVKLYEWGFKYDGSDKLTVEDFLCRVQMAQQSSPYTWDQVYNYFHQILEGTLVNWYWQYRKKNVRGNYTMMKDRLLEEYGSKDTDIDVWKSMMKRTQRVGETFMNFYRDMDDLHSRLSVRKSDKEMIDLLKCNVRDELALALAPFKTNSLSEFKNLCRDVDDVMFKRNIGSQKASFRKSVHEINQEKVEQECEVEAVSSGRNFRKRDINQYICFNCDENGHGFRDCPSEKRCLFCYRCGEKNVTSPNCPVCQENRKRSD